jgi:two-component system, cell cycle sensor histidine kinase and response regulator CckA
MSVFLHAVDTEVVEGTAKIMKPANGTCTVLVIEDEEMVMDVSIKMLERLEYHVLQARNGSEAYSIVGTYNGDIDLAIMDVNLPDMMGGTLYPVIIKKRPNMKVIVSSGYDLEGPVQDILDAGAKGFIKKPYSLTTLSAKLNEVLCTG